MEAIIFSSTVLCLDEIEEKSIHQVENDGFVFNASANIIFIGGKFFLNSLEYPQVIDLDVMLYILGNALCVMLSLSLSLSLSHYLSLSLSLSLDLSIYLSIYLSISLLFSLANL